MNLSHGTYLAPESHAYPNGGQTRRCLALYPDDRIRVAWAGIPDTFFSIPAHGRLNDRYIHGYLTVEDDNALHFHADKAAASEGRERSKI